MKMRWALVADSFPMALNTESSRVHVNTGARVVRSSWRILDRNAMIGWFKVSRCLRYSWGSENQIKSKSKSKSKVA